MEIRRLTADDLEAAMELKNAAGWFQTEEDWRRLMRLQPGGCFAACEEGRVVGTMTTTTYGTDLAWIGMVLVDPAYRRHGIGSNLMRTALDYLLQSGVKTIKLDATPAGRPVYEKMGFEQESLVERWEVESQVSSFSYVSPKGEHDWIQGSWAELVELDRRAFGADRSQLLDSLRKDSLVPPIILKTLNGSVSGFAFARPGAAGTYIGPLIATCTSAAADLLDAIMAQPGLRIVIDYHTGFARGNEMLRKRGFVMKRELFRMGLGEKSAAGMSDLVFAIGGPEVG